MSSMVLKPQLLLDCSLSMSIKAQEESDAKTILPGDFLVRIQPAAVPSARGAHFLMIHTIALPSAVYLDQEFISSQLSRVKLCIE